MLKRRLGDMEITIISRKELEEFKAKGRLDIPAKFYLYGQPENPDSPDCPELCSRPMNRAERRRQKRNGVH